MQGDGNLVLYRGRQALWNTRTFAAESYLRMQSDGNLVIYRPDRSAGWHAGTHGHPLAHPRLQDDGNLVIYGSSERALWATHTQIAVRAPSDDYPLKDGKIGSPDPWGFDTRWCTSFVAWRLHDRFGVSVRGFGHAGNWLNDDTGGKYTVPTPSVGDVAVKDNHVAWVAAVSSDRRKVRLEHYNWDADGKGTYEFRYYYDQSWRQASDWQFLRIR
jgi:surface antigen